MKDSSIVNKLIQSFFRQKAAFESFQQQRVDLLADQDIITTHVETTQQLASLKDSSLQSSQSAISAIDIKNKNHSLAKVLSLLPYTEYESQESVTKFLQTVIDKSIYSKVAKILGQTEEYKILNKTEQAKIFSTNGLISTLLDLTANTLEFMADIAYHKASNGKFLQNSGILFVIWAASKSASEIFKAEKSKLLKAEKSTILSDFFTVIENRESDLFAKIVKTIVPKGEPLSKDKLTLFLKFKHSLDNHTTDSLENICTLLTKMDQTTIKYLLQPASTEHLKNIAKADTKMLEIGQMSVISAIMSYGLESKDAADNKDSSIFADSTSIWLDVESSQRLSQITGKELQASALLHTPKLSITMTATDAACNIAEDALLKVEDVQPIGNTYLSTLEL